MIVRGSEALRLFVTLPIDGVVLDIGSGNKDHSDHMKSMGLDVVTLDAHKDADIYSLWPTELDFQVGAVWCSMVLEHSRNPGHFLDAIGKVLKPDGWLAITVPPLKMEIVGGHLSLWNAGLLLYNLIVAGFDCRDAKVKTHDYNVSVIVKHKRFDLPPLKNDKGDIETLSEFFPFPVQQGFFGFIHELNWHR